MSAQTSAVSTATPTSVPIIKKNASCARIKRFFVSSLVGADRDPAMKGPDGQRRRFLRGRHRRHQRQQQHEQGVGTHSSSHPEQWFCLLMKQLDGPCKNETNIQVSQHPLLTVYEHNTGVVSDKATKAARGHWMPEVIVGPFTTKEYAVEYQQNWSTQSRGVMSKRKLVLDLTDSWRRAHRDQPLLYVYDKRIIPLDYNDYLNRNGLVQLQVPPVRVYDMIRGMLKAESVREGGAEEGIVAKDVQLQQ
jgi:hypothetical protein